MTLEHGVIMGLVAALSLALLWGFSMRTLYLGWRAKAKALRDELENRKW